MAKAWNAGILQRTGCLTGHGEHSSEPRNRELVNLIDWAAVMIAPVPIAGEGVYLHLLNNLVSPEIALTLNVPGKNSG